MLFCGIFALLVYLFATRDSPFIPDKLKPHKQFSKQDVINWNAWRGGMFTEDFADGGGDFRSVGDFGDIGSKLGTQVNCVANLEMNPPDGGPGCSYDYLNNYDDSDSMVPITPETEIFSRSLEGFGNYMLPDENISPAQLVAVEAKRAKRKIDAYRCNKQTLGKCGPEDQSTSAKTYANEYHNCSFKMNTPDYKNLPLGNYAQCTNNSLDNPNQLKVVGQGRWDYDTSHPEDRVSHVCYKRNFDKCMAAAGHKTY